MRAALLFLLLAAPADAQDPRTAPSYFVDAAMDLTTANALAVACPRLSVDPAAAAARSADAMRRLEEDGFAPDTLGETMADPTDLFAARRAAFLEKHGLDDAAPEGLVCRAGLAEIAEGSGIGALLLEVREE